jgi:glycosyltransferase involved in cell wall biosynthesis
MARFHDVTVLTLPEHRAGIERELGRLAGRQPLPEFVYFEGGPVSRWLRRVGGHRGQYQYWQRAARRLVAELHREKPFALMHHVTYAGYRYPTAIWGHGVPTIWGPVGGIEGMPPALLPWHHLRPLLFELLRYVANFFERFPFDALPRRAAQSTLSLVTMPETQHRFQRSGARCELMSTVGLPREQVSTRPLTAPTGPLELLFVGQIVTLKGVDLLIEALAAAQSEARLTFIGGGAFEAPARALVQRLGLQKRVTFTGRLPRAETLQRFAGFHVFGLPSLHDSGSFAALEAMANGLPVICLDCGGLAILVEADRGMKVPLGSRRETIIGVAAAIEFYDRNRGAIAEHGERAREFVRDHYDWDRKGEEMAACYERVLTSGNVG